MVLQSLEVYAAMRPGFQACGPAFGAISSALYTTAQPIAAGSQYSCALWQKQCKGSVNADSVPGCNVTAAHKSEL